MVGKNLLYESGLYINLSYSYRKPPEGLGEGGEAKVLADNFFLLRLLTWRICQHAVPMLTPSRELARKYYLYVRNIIQSHFNGTNTFGTMKICSRHG